MISDAALADWEGWVINIPMSHLFTVSRFDAPSGLAWLPLLLADALGVSSTFRSLNHLSSLTVLHQPHAILYAVK